ncbi:MAG: DNA pilot protein [Microviridae sp.]|nr:MAG: DNA pilot protein [Microviridae sp.]
MPIDPTAVLSAGAGILGGILGNSSQQNANFENQRFSLQMYQKQRADALADRAFENEYNSPAAQMARLKAAGLNPNLVYGNGASQVQSVNTRASKADSPSIQPSNFGFIQNAAMAAFDVIKTQQQINLLQEQVKTQKELGNLYNAKDAESRVMASLNKARTAGQDIANYIRGETKQTEIQKINADLKFTLDENQRRAALNSENVKQAVENILLLKARTAQSQAEKEKINKVIKTLDQQISIQQADVEWAKLMVTGKNQMLPKIAMMIIQRLLK